MQFMSEINSFIWQEIKQKRNLKFAHPYTINGAIP